MSGTIRSSEAVSVPADIPLEKSPSDSCSASQVEVPGYSTQTDEILWDHTMSGSDQEDSVSDTGTKPIGQTNCEYRDSYENDGNRNEFEEVMIKLKELAHSDTGSCVPGNMLYQWSCDIATDEDRNKIYDKWMSDLESWERQRLLWLDERGKEEGFRTSNEDRTFLIRVNNGGPGRLAFKTSSSDGRECEPLHLPQELTSVYEFTDRNLWRKHHECFKEGKYSND